MTQPIVVGVDGAEDSQRAALWAASWAAATKTPLRVLSANRLPTGGADERMQRSLDEAARLATDAIKQVQPDLEVEAVTLVEHPVTAMRLMSRESAALVLGTAGEGGWGGLPSGSVSSAAAAGAHCPAIIISPQCPTTYSPDGDIALAADGKGASIAAAAFGFEAAAAEGRRMRIVISADAADQREQRVKDFLKAEVEARPGLDFVQVIEDMPVIDLLERESEGAALLIIASRGHGGVGGFLLGDTARELSRRAHCPLLVHTDRTEHIWPLATRG